MKIGIGIPSPDRVHPDFMINLTEIIQNTKHEVVIEKEQGVRTDRNRNMILSRIKGVSHILWLDADMIYPKDIIDTYMEEDFDVIGCLYFSREVPYKPIGYVDSGNKVTPYKPIMPHLVKHGKTYEVAGLGFGGMMVNMSVYKTLGKDKWMNYGKYFHIPPPLRVGKQKEDGLTHDLEFCKNVKKHGLSIKLHGSVRPCHISDRLIDEDDFKAEDNIEILRFPKVLVMVDGDGKEIQARAGMPCDVKRLKGKTFVGAVSKCIKKNPDYEFYVPLGHGVVSKQGWLKEAIICQASTGAGLVAFNDCFCMFDRQWLSEIAFDYKNAESIAKKTYRFTTAPKAIIIQTQYH